MPGTAQTNNLTKMVVVYNDTVCIPANELIAVNGRTGIGSEKGFITECTYYAMIRRGQLTVIRRSTPGNPALVEFDTMRPDIKRRYIKENGDPHAELSARGQKSGLEEEIRYNNRAYSFFTMYRYGDSRCLTPEKINEYTLTVNVMEALLRVRDRHRKAVVGGRTRINVWERLEAQCRGLLDLTDTKGRRLFPHRLPASWKSLKRKCEAYEEARRESEEAAFMTVIHKNYGNAAASKMKAKETAGHSGLAESLIRQFLGLHMNWNNVQIMEEYNRAAAVFGLEEIKSPATVGAYREKFDTLTKTRRRGSGAWHSDLKKQIRRSAPDTAFTFLVFDGWDVEMLYRKEETRRVRKGGTVKEETRETYHNRKTIVVVLDACCKYPVGYAIGDSECDALIKEALTDAVRHASRLFGARYMPVQLQCDNYHSKSLFPFYERMCKHLTPAEVKNAQAKVIEPYFRYLITKYFQKFPSFSGFGITASKDIQPNLAWLQQHRHLIPTEEECVRKIREAMEQERAMKLDAYMEAWRNTPDDRKLPFPDEQYLSLMGVCGSRTNKLEARGIILERNGMQHVYDSLDRSLLDHLGTSWIVRYDPEDMSRILISNAGKKGTKDEGREIGSLRYVLEEKEAVPIALADQKPEHFEQRRRVRDFNESLKREIVGTAENDVETIRSNVYNTGLPGHNILERLLITDSRGQHKDNRNALKLEAEDIEPEEERKPKVPYPDDDEDFEFDPLGANFSR